MDKEKWNLPFDRRFLVIGLVLAVLIAAVAVGFNRNSFYDPLSQENQQGPGAPEPPPGEEDGEELSLIHISAIVSRYNQREKNQALKLALEKRS